MQEGRITGQTTDDEEVPKMDLRTVVSPPEGGFYNSLHEFTICSQASLPGRWTDVSAGLDIGAPLDL